jgi:hypothetical protein
LFEALALMNQKGCNRIQVLSLVSIHGQKKNEKCVRITYFFLAATCRFPSLALPLLIAPPPT